MSSRSPGERNGPWPHLLLTWPALALLGRIQSVGLPTFTMDLHVFTLSFGFMLNINFFTILGFVLAWLFYRRL